MSRFEFDGKYFKDGNKRIALLHSDGKTIKNDSNKTVGYIKVD